MKTENIFITPSEAGRILYCTANTVKNYCSKGMLTGEKNAITGVWKVSLASVLKLFEETGGERR